jgi:hypothetical protein
MRFPYFVKKTAPISGAQSQLDYEVCWEGGVSEEDEYSFGMHVIVPSRARPLMSAGASGTPTPCACSSGQRGWIRRIPWSV